MSLQIPSVDSVQYSHLDELRKPGVLTLIAPAWVLGALTWARRGALDVKAANVGRRSDHEIRARDSIRYALNNR